MFLFYVAKTADIGGVDLGPYPTSKKQQALAKGPALATGPDPAIKKKLDPDLTEF